MSVADSALFVCYGLIFVMGILGNVLIIVFFGFKMKQMTSFRLFLIHLAITDCLCSIMAPFIYIHELVSPKWELGTVSCKVLPVIPSVTITISAWILCGISYERYRAIAHPLKKRFSPAVVHGYCGLLWIISILCFIPHFIMLTDSDGHCRLHLKTKAQAMGTTFMYFGIQCFIPLFILTVFFVYIYKQSRNHSKIPVQALLLSVICFAFCELPQTLFYISALVIHLYFPDFSHPVHLKVYTWLLVLLYANSVMNCFIYAGKFKKFRHYIGTFFGRKEDDSCYEGALLTMHSTATTTP